MSRVTAIKCYVSRFLSRPCFPPKQPSATSYGHPAGGENFTHYVFFLFSGHENGLMNAGCVDI